MSVPKIFAHRGSSAVEPENTLAAFHRARVDGADGVELDVMRCASGEVIVFHDDDLQRLCGVSGNPRERSWSALRELRVRGEAIPLLTEVLETLGPNLSVNVELKTAPGKGWLRNDGLARSVADILEQHEMSARSIVSSFDPILLARFHRCTRAVAIGFLFAADQSLPLRRGWPTSFVGANAVHPERVLVDEKRVARWHQRGLAVNVWTVDDPGELRYLASIGVDAVITNRPLEARVALSV